MFFYGRSSLSTVSRGPGVPCPPEGCSQKTGLPAEVRNTRLWALPWAGSGLPRGFRGPARTLAPARRWRPRCSTREGRWKAAGAWQGGPGVSFLAERPESGASAPVSAADGGSLAAGPAAASRVTEVSLLCLGVPMLDFQTSGDHSCAARNGNFGPN